MSDTHTHARTVTHTHTLTHSLTNTHMLSHPHTLALADPTMSYSEAYTLDYDFLVKTVLVQQCVASEALPPQETS